MTKTTLQLRALVKVVLVAVIVSFYLFPVGLRGLPESINTKQMLAVFGASLYFLKCAVNGGLHFNQKIFISFIYALVFSLWCYFCCILNNTNDYVYARYFISFFVWIASAYGVISIIKTAHGDATLPMLAQYIAAVCIAQGVIALMVDDIPAVKSFVDTWFIQDKRTIEVHRLYGIGCSLDSGGVRMCFAEVLLAHQLVTNKSLALSKKMIFCYAASLVAIGVLGNMIARTATVGLLLAALYFIYGYVTKIHGGNVSRRQETIWRIVLAIIVVAFAAGTYLYRTNASFHDDIRFAFEGFFSLFETGEFHTGSTDTLNERMWIWPWDLKGWICGYGLFEWVNWYESGLQTDIGYCRFTLYCGIVGLAIFSLYFIYNATVVAKTLKDSRVFSLVLLAMTFIIWIKVSTDIFQLYALLFCLPWGHEDDKLQLDKE